MVSILIVEDDKNISTMVEEYLTNDGFSVTIAEDGISAIEIFAQQNFQLVLLDLMLPGMDGMKVMKQLRQNSVTPIIIMSAKDSELDKAMGLGFGADDYITKPFSLIELSARIKANIRRVTTYTSEPKEEGTQYVIKDLVIDLQQHLVKKGEEVIELTSKEFDILCLLAKNPGRVFSKEQIYDLVWKDPYCGDANVINVHMKRLREKIGDSTTEAIYIKTVWGIGYKIMEDGK
ncbi:response regulator transcription factor [Anaerosporobacter faecicola]|uniref:response regulator transcription factor n=1 Tax=Anaerosporobacter faecicola TaxID=2718714 RepID=UPI0023682270|nr:response regulator transcription factor [Anaerosporobacter faecicola]